jgi:hypothetical protein
MRSKSKQLVQTSTKVAVTCPVSDIEREDIGNGDERLVAVIIVIIQGDGIVD